MGTAHLSTGMRITPPCPEMGTFPSSPLPTAHRGKPSFMVVFFLILKNKIMFLQLKPSHDEQSGWKRAQGPARVPPAPGKAQFGVPRQPPTLCAPHRGLLSPGCIRTHPCEWVFLGGGGTGGCWCTSATGPSLGTAAAALRLQPGNLHPKSKVLGGARRSRGAEKLETRGQRVYRYIYISIY